MRGAIAPMNIQLEPWLLLLMPIAMALLPMGVVMMTAFTKISIVLALLRNALGVPQVPSNLVLAGISMAATLLVMAPVGVEIGARLDVDGILAGTVQPTAPEVLKGILGPLEVFMRRHVDPVEMDALAEVAAQVAPGLERSSDSLSILIPAFVFSEVGQAFRIGMYLAIGFAVIDLVVANLMMAMGMTMFPPNIISTPLKLMVFVLTAGLSRLLHGLIGSYGA